MKRIVMASIISLACGPASAQSAGTASGTARCSNVINVTGSYTMPAQPQDLLINSKNEGLVLIRKIQGCTTVAERLRESADVVKAECRP